MPKSRSRRNRRSQPPVRKPRRSPKWVPRVGLGLLAVGVVLVVLGFLLELPGEGLYILVGFGTMAAALIALSYYR